MTEPTDLKVWYDWPLILAYHSVSPSRRDSLAVSVPAFEQQLDWLRARGYRSITLGEYLKGGIPRGERIVIITFDDGYADNYRHAWPALRARGMVATIFLVTDYVGTERTFPWDEPKLRASAAVEDYRVLSWEEAGELAEAGLELGSHTATHPELAGLPDQAIRLELERSRRELEERLGRPVESFCYPRGSVTPRVMQLAEAAGYAGGVVSRPQFKVPLSRFALRRAGIYQADTMLRFQLKTRPWLRLLSYEVLRRPRVRA